MAEDGPTSSMVRFDEAGDALETLTPPRFPGEQPAPFELRGESGGIRAGVLFSPGLVWRREPDGGVWGGLTGNYTLFRLGPDGDTLRVVTREFEPLPVTAEDVERAMESLAWFTEQGGRVDGSRFPDMKLAVQYVVVARIPR